jgi:uncharacterized protein
MRYVNTRKSKYEFRAGRSSAGLGLFTQTPIKRWDFVIEYAGKLLTKEESDKKSGKYLFRINRKFTLDGSLRRNLARYINHSCKPNCYVEMDGRRLFIYAKKKIDEGEELTYNYGREYFEDLIKPSGCRCEACLYKK